MQPRHAPTDRLRNRQIRIEMLGWFCFMALLIATIGVDRAPADSTNATHPRATAASAAGSAECIADIAPPGGDDQGNVNDLLAVINNWGQCPKDPPPVCDPTGTWVNAVAPNYSCFFGRISFNIATWQFNQVGGNLWVTPSGESFQLTGPPADCEPGNSFTVSYTLNGSCTETYILSGTFSSTDQFTGTFNVMFTGGNCFDCTNQVFNITATRQ